MSQYDLPEERLATTSEDGSRVYLFPADVRGLFRRLRNHAYDVLLVIFLILPWIKINDQPVLLFDIPNRKFHIFGLSFWGHDAPILFLVLLTLVSFVGLVTAVLGRAWCGWGCPQTVFIDRVYRRIERWIEGNAQQRRKLSQDPFTFKKFRMKTLKWSIYLFVSLIITHSFLAYFVGTERLMEMIQHSPVENPTSFLIILLTTALILFDFGWFREQFCIIACPYGRFQSVLMDESSLVIAYDEKRGEPRKGTATDKEGDCVNCYRCVQVCPTGIDIRRGVQMECIACTACIDACDEIMVKQNKPKGLIRYDTERGLEKKKTQHFRLRVILYSVVLVFAIGALNYVVSNRNLIKVNFVRPQANPYQLTDQDTRVINHFKVNIRNQYPSDVNIIFRISEELKEKGIQLTTPISPLPLEAGSSFRADVFYSFPRKLLTSTKLVVSSQILLYQNEELTKTIEKEVPLVGPLLSENS